MKVMWYKVTTGKAAHLAHNVQTTLQNDFDITWLEQCIWEAVMMYMYMYVYKYIYFPFYVGHVYL